MSSTNVQLVAPGGGCLAVQSIVAPGGRAGLVIVPCNSTDVTQTFTWDDANLLLKQGGNCVDVHSGGPIVWMYGCNAGSRNDRLQIKADGTLSAGNRCLGVEAIDPAGSTFAWTLQAWAKPLPEDKGLALLLINPAAAAVDVEVPLWMLPLTGSGANLTGKSLGVRDIWKHSDQTPVAAGASTLKMTVNGKDSMFVRLSVKAEEP